MIRDQRGCTETRYSHCSSSTSQDISLDISPDISPDISLHISLDISPFLSDHITSCRTEPPGSPASPSLCSPSVSTSANSLNTELRYYLLEKRLTPSFDISYKFP